MVTQTLIATEDVQEAKLETAGGIAYSNFSESISSPETSIVYRHALNDFAKYLRLQGLSIKTADDLMSADNKVIQTRLTQYIVSLKNKGLNWSTLNVRKNALYLFYEMNDIGFDSSFKKKLKKKMGIRTKAKQSDRPYNIKELKQMLQAAPSARMRAICLLFVSTAMRRACMTGLNWGDFEPIELPDNLGKIYKITGYRGDLNDQYEVPCTPEAAIAIDEYRSVLELQGVTITPQTPFLLTENTPVPRRLRPKALSSTLDNFLKSNELRKAGETFLTEAFKKFWDSICIKNKMPHYHKEKMISHRVGLDEHYGRLTWDDLLTEYIPMIQHLTINEQAQKQLVLTKKVNNLQGEQAKAISLLQSKIERLEQQGYVAQPAPPTPYIEGKSRYGPAAYEEDKKRYEHNLQVYNNQQAEEKALDEVLTKVRGA